MVTSNAQLDDQRRIDDHVEFDPREPAYGDARLRVSKIPVWAIVGYIHAVTDPAQVAKDYDIDIDEVRAAQAFYRKYDREIDERLRRTGTSWLVGESLPRP
jgi:uncharacterized protein (DUF433 family)